MNGNDPRVSWKIEEYTYREKSADWYWALGVIAVTGAVIAIILHNIFFAIFLILAAVILGFYAARKPDILDVAIFENGIKVNAFLYPFKKLTGFAIDIHELGSYLLIETNHSIMPIISIPLPEELDAEALEHLLKTKLTEKELKEPLSHKIMEHLGF